MSGTVGPGVPDAFGARQVGGADVASFRRAVARFATGVCVVSARIGRVDYAMTANAFASVSLEPLLVLVCVDRDARFHEAVEQSGCWAVSVLDSTARSVADWLSAPGRPVHGQLARVSHRSGPRTGAALAEQAVAWLECRTRDLHPAGDHSIVLGEVISVELAPEDRGVLVYHRSMYRRLP